MSRRDRFDAIVIGAGVVGSAAALGLAREGLRVALVEAHAPTPWREDAPDLRVYAFAPDNAELLQGLGVWPSVRAARVQPYRRMRVWDAAGGGELGFDADELGRDCLGYIVEHGLLVDRLWSTSAAEPMIERLCPDRLQAIEQGDAEVIATLESGRVLRARLLLGADGAGSRVRTLAGIETAAHDYHQRGLVAFVETERRHEDTCYQRFLTTGPLAFLPFPDGRSSIVWTLPEDEAARLLAVEETTFRRELTRAFDAGLGEVRAVSARAAFPLKRQLANSYAVGRVVLIGDAAHVVHPLAGQGVNLGLRDVAGLLDSVRQARDGNRDFAAPQSLQRWLRERQSENTLAAHAFEAINRLFSNDAPLPTLLRGHVLGLAGKIPPLTQLLWKRAAGM